MTAVVLGLALLVVIEAGAFFWVRRYARNLDVTLWACRRAHGHYALEIIPSSPAVEAEMANLQRMVREWDRTGIPTDGVQ